MQLIVLSGLCAVGSVDDISEVHAAHLYGQI
jgi:hypothetical protein